MERVEFDGVWEINTGSLDWLFGGEPIDVGASTPSRRWWARALGRLGFQWWDDLECQALPTSLEMDADGASATLAQHFECDVIAGTESRRSRLTWRGRHVWSSLWT